MIFKGIALFFFGFGIFILMQVLMPVLAFKTWEISNLDQNQLLDPKPNVLAGDLVGQDVLGVSIENINNFPAFITKGGYGVPPYSTFSLSIPRINLSDTMVKVNSLDFELNLGHLPGSSLPGEKGNIFITGHSSIWPRVNNKQKSFFMKLPEVQKGDEINLKALGQKFKYEVIGLKVVDPKDVSVINPPDKNGRYLSLMTCVPPGFNTKRLIVLARLKA